MKETFVPPNIPMLYENKELLLRDVPIQSGNYILGLFTILVSAE